MSALCRIWLVPADALPLSDAAVDLLRAARVRRVLRARSVLPANADPLAHSVTNGSSSQALDGALDDATLRQLSQSHPAESLAIACTREDALRLAHAALSLADDAALAPGRFELAAFDWPSSADLDGRPALIGIDLDWLPPPPPSRRAKFPGGPGSAPAR